MRIHLVLNTSIIDVKLFISGKNSLNNFKKISSKKNKNLYFYWKRALKYIANQKHIKKLMPNN